MALTTTRIIEIADQTRTAEPGKDGYILPVSFARAIEKEIGDQDKALIAELRAALIAYSQIDAALVLAKADGRLEKAP